MRLKRKIAAITAADVAGYSKLIAQDEEGTLARLAAYRAIFEAAINNARGRVFNTAGDSILAEFSSAVDAVRCAIRVQEQLKAQNQDLPADKQMQFRIGITIGDVVERDGDLLGDGVNIAARLQSIAPVGGICISRSVNEAITNKVSVRFEDRGAQRLKNIPDPVQAYAYAPGMEARPAARAQTPKVAAMLAVATVASAVAVYWGTSAWRATPSTTTVAAAPGHTEVAGTPPGSLPAARPETITSAETPRANPSNGSIAPAATFEPTPPTSAPTSVATTPVAATEQSSAQPTPNSDPPATTTTQPQPQPDVAPERLALAVANCNDSSLENAIDPCRAVLDEKAQSATERAKAALRLGQGLRAKQDPQSSIDALNRAIELSPSAPAYNHRGIAHYDLDQWDAAIKDYTSAIRLEPKDGEAYNNRAWTYYKMGRLQDGLADADKAVAALGNKDYTWDTRGHIHEALGNREQAIADYTQALVIEPFSTSSRDGLKRLNAQPPPR